MYSGHPALHPGECRNYEKTIQTGFVFQYKRKQKNRLLVSKIQTSGNRRRSAQEKSHSDEITAAGRHQFAGNDAGVLPDTKHLLKVALVVAGAGLSLYLLKRRFF